MRRYIAEFDYLCARKTLRMRVVQVRSDRSREVSGLRVPADETIICKQIQ